MIERENTTKQAGTNESLGSKLLRLFIEGFESYGNTAGAIEQAYWFGEVEPREKPTRPPHEEI